MSSDEIIVVAYDPSWPSRFQAEAELLADALAPMELMIEHVGSTSVPGLCAKPVIDILVGTEELRPASVYEKGLSRIGYVLGDSEESGRHFFAKVPRTAHVHVVRFRSWDWYSKIWYRDKLRGDPKYRDEYAALKRELAITFRADRNAYSKAKDELVERGLRQETCSRLIHVRRHAP